LLALSAGAGLGASLAERFFLGMAGGDFLATGFVCLVAGRLRAPWSEGQTHQQPLPKEMRRIVVRSKKRVAGSQINIRLQKLLR